mgnify:CR=1 FL=1
MTRSSRDDLRDLITEVVSSFKEDSRVWLLESPEPRVLNEGVYDPGILKAVFTAGGPGSGKSFMADVVFGVRDDKNKKIFQKASFVGATGLKYVNSDLLFEKGLAAAGINPKLLAQISQENPDLWDYIQDPTDPDSIRSVAKRKLGKLRGFYEGSRLGLLIDGTGKNYMKIEKDKKKLEDLGYDTSMLFVDTNLPVAIERDEARDRTLGKEKVTELWTQVRKNKDRLASLFGDNYQVVENSEYGPPPEEVIKKIDNFVSGPIKNPIGQDWVRHQIEQKNRK